MKDFQVVFVVSMIPIIKAHNISILLLLQLNCPSFMKNQLDLLIIYSLNMVH